MNHNFIQGKKAKSRYLLNRAYLAEFNNSNSYCNCVQLITNKKYNTSSDILQTENERVARILTGTLGGRIMYGNKYQPVTLNYLGDKEGQPGGSSAPLRNNF